MLGCDFMEKYEDLYAKSVEQLCVDSKLTNQLLSKMERISESILLKIWRHLNKLPRI
jgi:hypothetical protein